jgi:cytochrome b6-f complex iron-sulfur subunit
MSEPQPGNTPSPATEANSAGPPTSASEKPAAETAVGSATAAPPKPSPASSAPPKPTAAPPKPTAGAGKGGATRRFFLVSWFGSWFAAAWVFFTASVTGMLLGTVRFLFPNALAEPPSTFRAGDAASYEEGKVDDKFKELGAWVIRNKDEKNRDIIYALSTTCTHLGCTPNWLEGEKKFKCPCHGSGFQISGVNFEGPAPRPLERYGISRTAEGQIIVDKARKFQKELGQWDDPGSYILL